MRVNPKTQTPIAASIVIGIIAELILVVNIGQPKIFTVLTSIAIIMIYLAYLMVTGPLPNKRLQGQWPPADLAAGGYFSMGIWGMLVNYGRSPPWRWNGTQSGMATLSHLRHALV